MSRILIATIGMATRTGTEIVTMETAQGLRRRGHEVVVFTPKIGPSGERLQADGFTVVSQLDAANWAPDLIQANQTSPLVEAICRYPRVPCVSICHDAAVWYSEPVDIPTIRKHAAVSIVCRERIRRRLQHLDGTVELLHNAVDMDRFLPRPPLPSRPKRALILTKHERHLDVLRRACRRSGLECDALGSGARNEVADLHSRLPGYDVVFATARMAIEAMAVGCAVIVVDARGLAGMVTSDVVSGWRDENFGVALLTRKLTVRAIVEEIARFDARDAAQVSERIRLQSSLSSYLDRLEAMHRDIIVEDACRSVHPDDLLASLGDAFHRLVMAQQQQLEERASPSRLRKMMQRMPMPARLKEALKRVLDG